VSTVGSKAAVYASKSVLAVAGVRDGHAEVVDLALPLSLADRPDVLAGFDFRRTMTFCMCPLTFGIAVPRKADLRPVPVDAKAAPTDSTIATVSATRSSPPDEHQAAREAPFSTS
jgi:hypothetical protein